MIKVYSWVVRFVNNCRIDREHRIIGELTVNEIIDSEQMIKNTQKEAFLDEFVALQKATSKLLKLYPKLDEDSLMRCDSRLQYAEFLPYDVRYPTILPRRNYITKLIVKHYHEVGNHAAGTNQILAALSKRFWIVAA